MTFFVKMDAIDKVFGPYMGTTVFGHLPYRACVCFISAGIACEF